VPGRSVICAGRPRLALVPTGAPEGEREQFSTQAIMTAGSIVIPGVSSSAAAARRLGSFRFKGFDFPSEVWPRGIRTALSRSGT